MLPIRIRSRTRPHNEDWELLIPGPDLRHPHNDTIKWHNPYHPSSLNPPGLIAVTTGATGTPLRQPGSLIPDVPHDSLQLPAPEQAAVASWATQLDDITSTAQGHGQDVLTSYISDLQQSINRPRLTVLRRIVSSVKGTFTKSRPRRALLQPFKPGGKGSPRSLPPLLPLPPAHPSQAGHCSGPPDPVPHFLSVCISEPISRTHEPQIASLTAGSSPNGSPGTPPQLMRRLEFSSCSQEEPALPTASNDTRESSSSEGTDELSDAEDASSFSESDPAESASSSILADALSQQQLGGRMLPPLLDRAKQLLVDRLMGEFHQLLSPGSLPTTCAGSPRSQASPAPDLTSTSASTSANGAGTSSYGGSATSTGKQAHRMDGDEDGGDPPNNDPPYKKAKLLPPSEPASLLGCPYYKRNPLCTMNHRICSGPGWKDCHRLKEHLYRKHALPILCERCSTDFKSESELSSHLRKDPVCDVVVGKLLVGFNKEQERLLRSRKKNGKSEPERWREVYKVLFPDDDESRIPSPYYTETQTAVLERVRSDEMLRVEEFSRRELPRLVREALVQRVQGSMNPIENELRRELVNIVRDCQEALFRQYSTRKETPSERVDLDSGEGAGSAMPTIPGLAITRPPLSEPDAMPAFPTGPMSTDCTEGAVLTPLEPTTLHGGSSESSGPHCHSDSGYGSIQQLARAGSPTGVQQAVHAHAEMSQPAAQPSPMKALQDGGSHSDEAGETQFWDDLNFDHDFESFGLGARTLLADPGLSEWPDFSEVAGSPGCLYQYQSF